MYVCLCLFVCVVRQDDDDYDELHPIDRKFQLPSRFVCMGMRVCVCVCVCLFVCVVRQDDDDYDELDPVHYT